MITRILLAILIGWISTACQTTPQPPRLRLYDLKSRQTLAEHQVAERLSSQRLLLVGEQHSNPDHHAAQLAVIRFLHAQGVRVAVGLEMFRQNRQAVLDRWVAGGVSENAFKREYRDNPDRAMVLIAGSGHTQRPGIPAQLDEQATLPYAILLPETKGSFEREHIDTTAADYLIPPP